MLQLETSIVGKFTEQRNSSQSSKTSHGDQIRDVIGLKNHVACSLREPTKMN